MPFRPLLFVLLVAAILLSCKKNPSPSELPLNEISNRTYSEAWLEIEKMENYKEMLAREGNMQKCI